MSVSLIKSTQINDLKRQNESDSNAESTVYLELYRSPQKMNNTLFCVSNKDEIRAALEKLHVKLKQLTFDRDLAEKSRENVRNAREFENNITNNAFSRSFEEATYDCDAIEEKLKNILHNTRSEIPRELNYDSFSSIEPKSGNKVDTIISKDRFNIHRETKTREMVEKTRKRRQEDKFQRKPTCFVSPGVSTETHSLTANMQTLINVLSLQNPRLAVETNSFVIIDQILDILERYLRDMVIELRKTICFLTIKWMERVKKSRNATINDDTSFLKLEIKTLKVKRENLTSHLREIVKLHGQVRRLQKQRKGLADVKLSKPKLKREKKVSERIQDVASDINAELIHCLKRFLFLLKL